MVRANDIRFDRRRKREAPAGQAWISGRCNTDANGHFRESPDGSTVEHVLEVAIGYALLPRSVMHGVDREFRLGLGQR